MSSSCKSFGCCSSVRADLIRTIASIDKVNLSRSTYDKSHTINQSPHNSVSPMQEVARIHIDIIPTGPVALRCSRYYINMHSGYLLHRRNTVVLWLIVCDLSYLETVHFAKSKGRKGRDCVWEGLLLLQTFVWYTGVIVTAIPQFLVQIIYQHALHTPITHVITVLKPVLHDIL